MNKLIYITLIFIVSIASQAAEVMPSDFLGRWQSDRELTLESVRNSTSIKNADREFFKEGVFGLQIFEFRENGYLTYFIGDKTPKNVLKYNIVEAGKDYVTLVSESSELNLKIKQTWHIEGNFIYSYIKEFGFKEYYRKVE